MNPPLIVVDHLSFAYTSEPILEDLSFSIESGEFIALIGPNGGGKTTLLKLLMGFLKPSKGTITINGKSPKQAGQELAYMPQNLYFDRQFPITVLELVLGGCLRSTHWWGGFGQKQKEDAAKAIERVGLAGYEQRPFGTLSGGESQRALFARALVSNPRILLLDEPCASVDQYAEKAIYELLYELIGKMTILMVTHDLNAVSNRVARVLCVQKKLSIMQPKEVCSHYALGLYHGLPMSGQP